MPPANPKFGKFAKKKAKPRAKVKRRDPIYIDGNRPRPMYVDYKDLELLGKLVGHNSHGGPPSVEDDAGSAYDSESSSTIHLSNGMVLYLKEVDTMLALVCLTRAENFRKKSLINYNIGCLKKALMALPQIAQEVSEGGI